MDDAASLPKIESNGRSSLCIDVATAFDRHARGEPVAGHPRPRHLHAEGHMLKTALDDPRVVLFDTHVLSSVAGC